MYILRHRSWHSVALLPCKILPSCSGPSWPQLLLLAKKALCPLAEVQTLLLSARLGHKKELQREGQQSLSFCRIPLRLFKPLSMSSILRPFYFLYSSGFQLTAQKGDSGWSVRVGTSWGILLPGNLEISGPFFLHFPDIPEPRYGGKKIKENSPLVLTKQQFWSSKLVYGKLSLKTKPRKFFLRVYCTPISQLKVFHISTFRVSENCRYQLCHLRTISS